MGRGRPRKHDDSQVTFGFRLSPALFTALKLAARYQRKTVAELLRDVVRNYLAEFSFSFSKLAITKIPEAVLKVKRFIAYAHVFKEALQTSKGRSSLPAEERQLKRTRLLEMGMDTAEQIYKIARTEQDAENSKYRIQAYQVLSRIIMVNAALLKGATDEEILERMIELEAENERLEAMGREIQTRAAQEAQALQQPATQTRKPK
jgi:hypothetical protein